MKRVAVLTGALVVCSGAALFAQGPIHISRVNGFGGFGFGRTGISSANLFNSTYQDLSSELGLDATGSLYDPRLVGYNFASFWDGNNTSVDQGRARSNGLSFNGNLSFLPERPFPFAVYFSRSHSNNNMRDIKIFGPRKKTVHVIRKYKGNPFGALVSVIADDTDNIYVSDSGAGRAMKFSSQGKFLSFIGGEEGAFKRPAAIAFNPRNRWLCIMDGARPRVFAYTTDGRMALKFGERGTGPGQFNFPTFLAVDRDGRLYVNDTLNLHVQIFTPESKFVREFGQAGVGSGNINRPKGMALDSEAHIYIAEGLFSTIQIFDAAGNFLLNFGQSGSGQGEFYIPAGRAVDREDRIFVADPFQHRLQVFQYHPEIKTQAQSLRGGGQ